MGLLDEAIKEHLDLKRRRGADPADVAREEREALGPAVREVRESMAQAEGEESAETGTEAGEAAPEPPVAEPSPAPQEPAPTAEEPAPVDAEESEQAPAAAPDSSVEQATQVFDADDFFAEEDVPVPDPEAPAGGEVRQPADPDSVRPDPAAPPPPTDHRDEPEAAHAAEGADVLEETPDFLQQTPESDRLWFDQKPPRDFDFDN